MHTQDAYHLSLALIDHLAAILARIQLHDARLARKLRNTATAIPQLVITGEPARMARAHRAAARVLAILDVTRAWGYTPGDHIAEAEHTARIVHQLTAP